MTMQGCLATLGQETRWFRSGQVEAEHFLEEYSEHAEAWYKIYAGGWFQDERGRVST
jgi:hypothetical protein